MSRIRFPLLILLLASLALASACGKRGHLQPHPDSSAQAAAPALAAIF